MRTLPNKKILQSNNYNWVGFCFLNLLKIGNQDGRLDAFVTTDKDFIEQFAGKIVEDSTTASPDIYQYLIQDLSENFKSKLDQPGIDQALFSI